VARIGEVVVWSAPKLLSVRMRIPTFWLIVTRLFEVSAQQRLGAEGWTHCLNIACLAERRARSGLASGGIDSAESLGRT